MLPALNHGDYVITSKPRSLRPGSIYVIDHIDLGRIVKRLERVEDNKAYFLGDNTASVPEAIIAPVDIKRISGQVKLVIGPQGIRRPRLPLLEC